MEGEDDAGGKEDEEVPEVEALRDQAGVGRNKEQEQASLQRQKWTASSPPTTSSNFSAAKSR